MLSISRYFIKQNDNIPAREKVFNEIWNENDFSNPQYLIFTICNKFIEEIIDIESDEFKRTISDCIDASNDIINYLLQRDVSKMQEYVETI